MLQCLHEAGEGRNQKKVGQPGHGGRSVLSISGAADDQLDEGWPDFFSALGKGQGRSKYWN